MSTEALDCRPSLELEDGGQGARGSRMGPLPNEKAAAFGDAS